MNTLKIEIPAGFKVESFDEKSGTVKFAALPKDIKERIKDFDDVLQYHGIREVDFDAECQDLSGDEIAYKQLKLIISALNEDWTADWKNSNQYKWYPYFDMNDGSSSSGRFSFNNSDNQNSNSNCSSHLCKQNNTANRGSSQKIKNFPKGVGSISENDFL